MKLSAEHELICCLCEVIPEGGVSFSQAPGCRRLHLYQQWQELSVERNGDCNQG